MKVAVTGRRARHLSKRISDIGLEFLPCEGALDSLDPVPLRVDAVLASAEGGPGSLGGFILAARRLRSERFFWGSIYLLAPDSLLVEDATLHRRLIVERWGVHLYDEKWKIYFDRQPPCDVARLVCDVAASDSLELDCRWRIFTDSLRQLAEDLVRLVDTFHADRLVTPESLYSSLKHAREALEASAKTAEFGGLVQQIEALLRAPDVIERDLKELQDLVRRTESRVIEVDQKLYAALHHLKNELLLVRRPQPGSASVQEALEQLERMEERVPEQEATLCELLKDLRSALVDVGSGDGPDRSAEQVRRLHVWLSRNEPGASLHANLSVRRILIIEDHAAWRERILGVVDRMGTGLPVQTAEDAASARDLLRQEEPALAIVDLGLPQRPGELPVPNAGLALLEQFSGTQHGTPLQHRFLVLTAAEDWPSAVAHALRLGLSPSAYLHKTTESVCQTELPARIRIALQPIPERLPEVVVLARTGRNAKVEGTEIVLDYPAWCLLAALAERPRWYLPAQRLAEILAREPYRLDPKSRDPDCKGADPQAIILRQLPHYASDLRASLENAYRQVRNEPARVPFVECDEDLGYRLNSRAAVLSEVGRESREMRPPTVLVIEDNDAWRRRLVEGLAIRGFRTTQACWVQEACEKLRGSEMPDLVSLDIELPASEAEYRAGTADASHALAFLDVLRRTAPDIPVAVLTGSAWNDRIAMPMLRGGIRLDDYVHKSGPDPVARLAASLARLWEESLRRTRILSWNEALPLHPLLIDHEVCLLKQVAGRPFAAGSAKERSLLEALSASPNTFVSQTVLVEALWKEDPPDDPDGALASHVARIRGAIQRQTGIPGNEVILSDRGAYMLRGIPQ